ncbi:MAG: HEAT repeat domain-containing protein [Armatimonadota bacterium]
MVQRARQDLDAFGELVERLREIIQRQCYHRVGDWQHAEDLAQEAFIRAYLKLDQLADPTRFVPWLRRIAANLCNEFLRSPIRREVATEAVEGDGVGDPAWPELSLALLPEETRRCVILFYQAGCSYAEIARITGSTVPAVKARLSRAKAVLRREMGDMTEKSAFTRRVMEKLEALQSEQPEERLHAVHDLRAGLAEDRYAKMLATLRGDFSAYQRELMDFERDMIIRGKMEEHRVRLTDWEKGLIIRGAIKRSKQYRAPEVRDALIDLLCHPSREVRVAAAGALAAQGDRAAVPALQRALDDPGNEPEVKAVMKSAISQLEKLPAPPAADQEDRKLRRDLTEAAEGKRSRVELLRRLTAALRDPSPKVRSQAVKALEELGDKRAVIPLLPLLADPVRGVQLAAVKALGTLKSPRAVPALMHYVEASPNIRDDIVALYALGEIGDPRALPAVLRAMEDGPFYLAGILGNEGVITSLVTHENLHLLKETITRMEAQYRWKPPRKLVGGQVRTEWDTAKVALQGIYHAALARVAEREDVPELLEAFARDPNNVDLVRAIERLAEPSMLEPMRRHLFAGHGWAAVILLELGGSGIDVLKDALRSSQPEVRIAVATAIFLEGGADVIRASGDEEILCLLDEVGERDPQTAVRMHAKAAATRIRKPQIWAK